MNKKAIFYTFVFSLGWLIVFYYSFVDNYLIPVFNGHIMAFTHTDSNIPVMVSFNLICAVIFMFEGVFEIQTAFKRRGL